MLLVPAAAGAEPVDTVLSSALLRDHVFGVRVPADAAGADARLAALSAFPRDAGRDLERFGALHDAFDLERSLLDHLTNPERVGFDNGAGLHDGILERFDAGAGQIVGRLAFDENRAPVSSGLERSREALSRAAQQVEATASNAQTERRIADLTARFEQRPPNDPVERSRALETIHSLIGASGLPGERAKRLASAADASLPGASRTPRAFALSEGIAEPVAADRKMSETATTSLQVAVPDEAPDGFEGPKASVSSGATTADGVAPPQSGAGYGSSSEAASGLRILNARHADAPLVAPPAAAEWEQRALALLNSDWGNGEPDYRQIERNTGVPSAAAQMMRAMAGAWPGQAENTGILAISEAVGDDDTRSVLGDLYVSLQSTDDPKERQALFGEIARVWTNHVIGAEAKPASRAGDRQASADYHRALRSLFENAGGLSGEQFIPLLDEAGLDVDMGLALHALLDATPEDADDQRGRLLIERAFQDMPQVQAVLAGYLDELQTGDNRTDPRARALDALEPMLPFLLKDPSAVPSLRPLLADIAAERRTIDAQSSVEQLEMFGRMVLDAMPGIGNVLSAHDAALAAIAAYDAFEAGETWEGTKDALAAIVSALGAIPALSTLVKGGRLAASAARGILRLLGAASRHGRDVLDDAAGTLLRRRVDGGDAFDAAPASGSRDITPEYARVVRDEQGQITDIIADRIYDRTDPEYIEMVAIADELGWIRKDWKISEMPGGCELIIASRAVGGHPTTITPNGNKQLTRRNRNQAVGRMSKVPGYHRSEWPPASSLEGGKGASTGYLPARESSVEGGHLGSMIAKAKPGQKLFIIVVNE